MTRNKGVGGRVFVYTIDYDVWGEQFMLALFLNHPPTFVAGEIALGLSLALFLGALITAIGGGASKMS